jgi:AraC-like DNA-binding protein
MNSYEVHYIHSGYGILVSNGCRYELFPGSLYITGPNIPHAQLIADKNPMWETSVFYKVTPIASKSAANSNYSFEEKLIVSSFLSHHFWIGHDMQNLQQLFTPLLNEITYNKYDSKMMIESYLKQLIILITRNYDDAKQVDSYMNKIDLNNQRFLIIDQAFLNDYKTLTLDRLSKKLGLSTRHTQRLLLEYYGLDFSHKRLQARMSQAKLILESTDKPIYEIAELVGYTTSEHFCNIFKKYFQITANHYRKQSKNH